MVFLGKSECPLCGKILEEGQEVFATTAFIQDAKHPLWWFHDAGMHQGCFMNWSEREAFIALFNEHYRGMQFMRSDGCIEEREPRPGGTA